jgi:DNA mismatch endonuclease, patch repair protein
VERRKQYGILRLVETHVVAESTRRSMRSNRSLDTAPELRLRKALWASGIRGYRKNVKGLPGRPDLVFTKGNLVVFVHGCYWHGCPKCIGDRVPHTNSAYWSAKIGGNKLRDARNQLALEALGYRVVVFWSCQLSATGLSEAVEQIRATLSASTPT